MLVRLFVFQFSTPIGSQYATVFGDWPAAAGQQKKQSAWCLSEFSFQMNAKIWANISSCPNFFPVTSCLNWLLTSPSCVYPSWPLFCRDPHAPQNTAGATFRVLSDDKGQTYPKEKPCMDFESRMCFSLEYVCLRHPVAMQSITSINPDRLISTETVPV